MRENLLNDIQKAISTGTDLLPLAVFMAVLY